MRVRNSAINGLLENGLPPWVLSWKTIIPASIIIPVLYIIGSSFFYDLRYKLLGPSHFAPDCFTLGYLPPLKAGKSGDGRFDEHVGKLQAQRKQRLEELEAVSRVCSLENCPDELKVFFANAALDYMAGRGKYMQLFYIWYGKAASDTARILYSQPEDETAIRLIRAHFDKGHFDIRALRGEYDLVLMTLFKPIEDLKLCTRD